MAAPGGASSSAPPHPLRRSDGLPRFSYRSTGHLLDPGNRRSFKGFLVTCPLGREKSATKEATSLLMEYLNPTSGCKGTALENESEHSRRKENGTSSSFLDGFTSDEERCSHSSNAIDLHESPEMDGNENGESTSKEKPNLNDKCGVFFLKMSQKGIVSIFVEDTSAHDPVDILSKVLEDSAKHPLRSYTISVDIVIQYGVIGCDKLITIKPLPLLSRMSVLGHTAPKESLGSLLSSEVFLGWCQRMIPIQATCLLSKESLGPLVVDLVKQHLRGLLPIKDQPLKFAIRYNRRGIATQEENGCKVSQLVLGRMDCIHVITDAVVEAASQLVVVDLETPQVVVIVEVIPVVGAHDVPICGVAVVSGSLMNTKPKLCIRPLSSVTHPSPRSQSNADVLC